MTAALHLYNSPWHKGQRLSNIVAKGPVYLWFMRYFGCTLCQLDIHKLKQQYGLFTGHGTKVIVVLQTMMKPS